MFPGHTHCTHECIDWSIESRCRTRVVYAVFVFLSHQAIHTGMTTLAVKPEMHVLLLFVYFEQLQRQKSD